MVRLAPDAQYRVSKRGLVLAGAGGDTVLFEHPHAATLPELLATDPDPAEIADQLGPPLQPDLIDELVAMGILTAAGPAPGTATDRARRVTLGRAGLMIAGIDKPARWLNNHLVPAITHPAGIAALCAVLIGGIAALVAGRPDLPPVSDTPALEALLMIGIGLAATIGHEFAHAVAIVHYGRTPRRAGFGFYWGAVSFFVDSTPAMTLPRKPRVIQALAGLAVDAVATAGFAIAAHLVPTPVLAIVFWRLAILGLVDIAINLAPILQVDGHWALADLLDEPDLAPRARRALGSALKRQLPQGQSWLAVYGALSLAVGVALIALTVAAFWATTHDLIIDLLTGNPAEMALGIYCVGPLILGVLFSTAGLLLETLLTPSIPDRSHQ
jgi:hypothetical protein